VGPLQDQVLCWLLSKASLLAGAGDPGPTPLAPRSPHLDAELHAVLRICGPAARIPVVAAAHDRSSTCPGGLIPVKRGCRTGVASLGQTIPTATDPPLLRPQSVF
jgi:hypothetical protein